MSPTALEAHRNNQLVESFDLDGLAAAAIATKIRQREPRGRWEHRDLALDNFDLIIERDDSEIGRATLTKWEDDSSRVVLIEDLSIADNLNNHSAYLAILMQAAEAQVAANVIEGLPTNDMAAVTLDLDTFNLLPEGWRARYFKQQGGELIELQYPFEVFDQIEGGEQVYHYLERIADN